MVQFHSPSENHPYRTAPTPPLTFVERLRKTRGVKPAIGFLTIIAVVAVFAFVVTVPGMLAMHLVVKPEKIATLKTLDKGMISIVITIGFAFACYISYKILRGLHEMSTDAGKAVLEWVELWLERRKQG